MSDAGAYLLRLEKLHLLARQRLNLLEKLNIVSAQETRTSEPALECILLNWPPVAQHSEPSLQTRVFPARPG